MDQVLLKALEEKGIEKFFKNLIAYTHSKLKNGGWQSGKRSGPKGEEAHDFVQEAFRLVLDPDKKRKWNKLKCPNLIQHFEGVIDSLISNAYGSKANTTSSSKIIEKVIQPSEKEDIVSTLEAHELYKRMKNKISESVRNDDDYIEFVFEELCEGKKPNAEIAGNLDLTLDQVKKYKNRIREILSTKTTT